MRLIRDLLKQAEKENQRDSKSFLTSRSKQKLREQWILGKFSENYNKKVKSKMIYAEVSEAPDFQVFDSANNWIFDVEITEALDEGRRRSSEYKTETEKVIFIPEVNYLPVIERLFSQKCSKAYPRATILILYFNVFSSIYDEFTSETFSPLSLPEKCSLSQIWLLDSGGDKILQII